jgi:hypothetical protein
MQSTDLRHATSLLERAKEIASIAGDHALTVRVEIIEGICAVIGGDEGGRDAVLAIMRSAPRHLDEIYSSGYSNLTYLDVEQRRLGDAERLLNVSLPMTVERDLPICRVWQLGARGRLSLLTGDWDDALSDAATVLDGRSAPLARTWPHLIRGLVALRRDGVGVDDLSEAWTLARGYGEPIRVLPALAALAEHAWVSGQTPSDLAEWRSLLEASSAPGLEWARGDLAMWLPRSPPMTSRHRIGAISMVTSAVPPQSSNGSAYRTKPPSRSPRLATIPAPVAVWTCSTESARRPLPARCALPYAYLVSSLFLPADAARRWGTPSV